jgi:hypothetical protein
MEKDRIVVGKVFGQKVDVTIRLYDHKPETDCVSMYIGDGPAEFSIQMKSTEFADFLNMATALVGGVVYYGEDDADSEV